MDKQPAIYIITNKPNGTLYIGVTSNLQARVWQHKSRLIKGFTTKYNLDKLVYFELHVDMYTAISREKQLKERSRRAKIGLIERDNPGWVDLYRG
jgi:putative endonuclease